MVFQPLHIVLVVLAVTGIYLWFSKIWPALKRARVYMSNMMTCGYLPGPPTPRAQRWLMRLSRILTFIQVGKVEITGRDKLNKVPGPFVVAPNHPSFMDPAIAAILLDRPARYMAARGVMTFGWGLGGLLTGPFGAFAADLTKGKGGPAREAGVKVLVDGQVLVMFPEGWAYMDGSLGEFKRGAVRIARQAYQALGKETYIVPVGMRYGKYPGAWIKKLPPPVEYLLVFLMFWYYRRGVKLVVGDPIPASTLHADDCVATEQLKQVIVDLIPPKK